MDLINWSLNAIDTIFSTRSVGSGEPTCPAGTYAAGYTMDSWSKWRIVCLAALSLEDVEDIYIIGTVITGILLIGICGALGYRRLSKAVSAQSPTKLTDWNGMLTGLKTVGTHVTVCDRKLDFILERLAELKRKLDNMETGERL